MGTICPGNDFLAQDFAPLALAGELAAVAAVPVQSEAEAGVIAAQRHVARSARNAQAAHGKTAPGRRAGAGGRAASWLPPMPGVAENPHAPAPGAGAGGAAYNHSFSTKE